jgi:hypothetical protein
LLFAPSMVMSTRFMQLGQSECETTNRNKPHYEDGNPLSPVQKARQPVI